MSKTQILADIDESKEEETLETSEQNEQPENQTHED